MRSLEDMYTIRRQFIAVSKKVPGWAVITEAIAGSVANMHMIRDGKALDERGLKVADISACDRRRPRARMP